MLKKGLRLKTQDFNTLLQTKKYYTEHFTIRVQGKNGIKGRFAVVAPKKLYKKAFLRNKAKRFVYDLLKNFDKSYEKVFIFINKDILNSEKNLILKEINEILG